jgi:predicted Zn-dependent protease
LELTKLKSLAMHEAGHALGLDGHSPFATDLMYWKSPLLKLSARDKKTLQLAYSPASDGLAAR